VDIHSEDLAEGLRIIGPPVNDMGLPHDLDTEEGRTRLHERSVRHLEAYARARQAHVRLVPDCNAAPLCNGAGVATALMVRADLWEPYPRALAWSAVALIADKNEEIADLRARLMVMDADLVDALGNLADTERQLFEAQTRLAACDEMLGSAVPPVLPTEGS
jgi:hypothetical protein